MRTDDDTKMRSVEVLAPLAEGHFLCRTEDGKLGNVATYEHCMTHHPAVIGELEMVRGVAPRPRATGPARVTSDAYRNSYDRVFGKNPVGEA